MKKIVALLLFLIFLCASVSALAGHTHEYDDYDWIFDKLPTCLADGRQFRVCRSPACGMYQYRVVPKLPHVYSTATCTKLATCNGCKGTLGTLAAHNYSTATCVKKATCSSCSATMGSLGAHKFSTATCIKKATCSVCQVTSGALAPHKMVNGKCSVCKK